MHRRDIGSLRLSWSELRVFIHHIGRDSAFYRASYPKSHDWDVNTELTAAVLCVLQWANWQRGGGKGDRPEMVKRPLEDGATIISKDISLEERKSKLDSEIERRRKARADSPRKPKMEVMDIE